MSKKGTEVQPAPTEPAGWYGRVALLPSGWSIGRQPYTGTRSWMLCDALPTANVLWNCSLVFPTFCKSGTTHGVRHFGTLDLDVNLESVSDGSEPQLFVDETPGKWLGVNTKAIKKHFVARVRQFRTGEAVQRESPPFARLLQQVQRIVHALSVNNVRHVCYYSGGRGFRILIQDESLWAHVDMNATYGKEALQRVVLPYLTKILESIEHEERSESPPIADFLDANVFDKEKGTQPNVRVHLETGLWSVRFPPTVLVSDTEDQSLTTDIVQFWSWMCKGASQVHNAITLRSRDESDPRAVSSVVRRKERTHTRDDSVNMAGLNISTDTTLVTLSNTGMVLANTAQYTAKEWLQSATDRVLSYTNETKSTPITDWGHVPLRVACTEAATATANAFVKNEVLLLERQLCNGDNATLIKYFSVVFGEAIVLQVHVENNCTLYRVSCDSFGETDPHPPWESSEGYFRSPSRRAVVQTVISEFRTWLCDKMREERDKGTRARTPIEVALFATISKQLLECLATTNLSGTKRHSPEVTYENVYENIVEHFPPCIIDIRTHALENKVLKDGRRMVYGGFLTSIGVTGDAIEAHWRTLLDNAFKEEYAGRAQRLSSKPYSYGCEHLVRRRLCPVGDIENTSVKHHVDRCRKQIVANNDERQVSGMWSPTSFFHGSVLRREKVKPRELLPSVTADQQ